MLPTSAYSLAYELALIAVTRPAVHVARCSRDYLCRDCEEAKYAALSHTTDSVVHCNEPEHQPRQPHCAGPRIGAPTQHPTAASCVSRRLCEASVADRACLYQFRKWTELTNDEADPLMS